MVARLTGTGLGLAMVEQIVLQAGGSIEMESAPDAGTTVTIDLPCVASPVAETSPIRQLVDAGYGPDRDQTILVVDDQADVARLTGRVLRMAGYNVVIATGASEALELMTMPPRIDLVVTDIVMPEIDGITLAETIQRLWPRTPVIFMSGYTADYLERDSDAPATEVLTKPFDRAVLLAAVEEKIRRNSD